MRPPSQDRARWGDASPAARAAAERVLAEARGFEPQVHVTLAEIEDATRAPAAGLRVRLLGAVAAGFVLVTGGVALSRGWLGRREPATSSVMKPSGGPATAVERRRRVRARRGVVDVLEVAGVSRGDDSAAVGGPAELERPSTASPAPSVVPPVPPVPSLRPEAPVLPAEIPSPEVPGSTAGAEPQRVPSPVARPSPRPLRSTPPAATRPSSVAGTPLPEAAGSGLPSPVTPPAFAAAPEPGSSAAAEMTQIRDALAQLRGERSAARALELLDTYDRRFPGGLWREEAAVIRVEALLAVGRPREALERFESISPAALDRSPRLRLTRAELRARFGRCRDAEADFTNVLAIPVTDEIRARAQRGLAACSK